MRPLLRPRALRPWLLAGACGAAGCAMPEPPGELVGVYAIEGALTHNDCGQEALPAADPLVFDVELRREDATGYWLQGMPPARPGQLDDDGRFRFELEQSYAVDPDRAPAPDPFSDMDPESLADPAYYEKLDDAARRGPCALRVVESVDGRVLRTLEAQGDEDAAVGGSGDGDGDEGETSPDLVADNSIEISVEAGSDCGLVLREQGGPFDTLPCSAHYALVGTMLRDE